MRILVTGATGLLGTDIVFTLENSGYEIIRGCYSDRGKEYIAADIRTEKGLSKLGSIEWDLVIHTSAAKNPDECEKNIDDTYRINTWATEQIAHTAKKRNAKMLFISTDYVFPGTNPPYSENAAKSQINYYGKSKSLAEDKIQEILPDACILRVPILYGIRAGLKASDLLNSSLKSINSNDSIKIDNFIVRYPTFTEDVAEAAKFLIEKKAKGIYHFSGQDRHTKYSMLKVIAELLDKKIDHIIPDNEYPESLAKRPVDCHLDMEKILSMGFEFPLPFKERIKKKIFYCLPAK